ncbi:hypothetical protein CLV68_5321 [Actinokineospora cianjurensis]|uniref:Secreted protein n=1 Tax=Actinokineospora cianjurensis TaxID=585224 RepID=A0A421AYN2_9PSEU|nr:hypothetical protein CLV68_5321 [Actinokineospora cianjurensis]
MVIGRARSAAGVGNRRGWAAARAGALRWFERTERRLVAASAVLAGVAVLLGVLGEAAVRERGALLDDAVARRGASTAAALDVYRALADADATSLNAVVVEAYRVGDERERYREDLFDATDALRATASLAPEESSARRVRKLLDHLPEYSRLVEAGWGNSALNQPVGTSYLGQASSLARDVLLGEAQELHREQATALSNAQLAAGRHPWEVYAVGAVLLVLLVLAQIYLARRTRRQLNRGLLLSTALVLTALIALGVSVNLAAGHAADSVDEFNGVIAPLAKARNLARIADGDEVRILVFPKVGDVGRLRDGLDALDGEITAARTSGGDRQRVDKAATALVSWRTAVAPLLGNQNPPLTYPEMSGLVIGTAQAAHAQRFDEALTDAIAWHTADAAASTAAAKGSLADTDLVFAVCVALALVSLGWGMWPRIREYY